MKGETAPEIAGFAEAARDAVPGMPQVDLDWPCYAAGRTRGLPWFLLAAKLLAGQGVRVLLHGWNGRDGRIRAALAELDIVMAETPAAAARALDRDSIVYLPLERVHPALFRLLDLRDTFGLRSCVNTVCRMLNPAGAAASVQGVFHPSYRLLQQDAAALLGWRNLMVIKGGGGEFERAPGKAVEAFGLRDGAAWQARLPALGEVPVRLADVPAEAGARRALWQTESGPRCARQLVLGTAQLALRCLPRSDDAAAARGAPGWRAA